MLLIMYFGTFSMLLVQDVHKQIFRKALNTTMKRRLLKEYQDNVKKFIRSSPAYMFKRGLNSSILKQAKLSFRRDETNHGTSQQTFMLIYSQKGLIRVVEQSQILKNGKFYIIMKHQQQFQMNKENQKRRRTNKTKRYAKISLKARMKLVDLVLQKSLPVRKASKKLSIKLSTAKLIVKKYKEEGTFFEKKADKLTRLNAAAEQQESQNSSMNFIEAGQIIGYINHQYPSPAFYWVKSYGLTQNPAIYQDFNSSLLWNQFGGFPQQNDYLSGNYFYYY